MLEHTQFSLSIKSGTHNSCGPSLTLLKDPGDLLASFPALFGFYPDRSVVFSTFGSGSCTDADDNNSSSLDMGARGDGFSTSHNLELGASFRLDVTDLELLPNLADCIEAISPQVVFAFLIGHYSGEEREAITRTLQDASEHAILQLDGVWHTPQIQTGGSYHRLFGGVAPLDQDRGVISDIGTTVVMQAAQNHNELPARTREDLFSTFAPTWDVLPEEDSASVANHARLCSRELMQLSAEELKEVLHSVAEDAHLILEETILAADKRSKGHVSHLNEDDLATLATYLCQAPFRDALLPMAVEHPSAVRALSLAVARNTSGDIRSNSLCWYAIAATADDMVNRALPALMVSLEENPEHSLSSLLLTALRLGRTDYVMEAVEHGQV